MLPADRILIPSPSKISALCEKFPPLQIMGTASPIPVPRLKCPVFVRAGRDIARAGLRLRL